MPNRRTFLGRMAAAASTFWTRAASAADDAFEPEYIVVGSGAGGGTVAARLAELGHKVLVLEAGGDPKKLSGGNAIRPNENTLPQDYDVPAFHPNSSENRAMRWDFFVRHYANIEQQKRDDKYRAEYENDPVDGVLYPRAGTLGGCTAHNAMILVYPHNEDWQGIVDATGDKTWGPEHMRHYFERLENCHHRAVPRLLKFLFGLNLTKHGFRGWLQTEKALPLDVALEDKPLLRTVHDAFQSTFQAIGHPGEQIIQGIESFNDPNDWRLVKAHAEGIRYTPLTTSGHARTGTRERLLSVQARYPNRLRIETDALATKVLFNDQKRAVGVEYRKGRALYRTHGKPAEQGETKTARASREVILCGGAFNTPQLLMLSGVGPQAELDRFQIPPVKVLEGVGKNLQDRYEVGVVHRAPQDWNSLHEATFLKGDVPYNKWAASHRGGIYTSNGAVLAAIRRSTAERPLPDLFYFGIVSNFHGYFPGYSKVIADEHNKLTCCILKAHTLNRGGEVTLRSADPLVAPGINFHYFEEGTDTQGEDLDSVVRGIKDVRAVAAAIPSLTEEIPGPACQSDEQIKQFVRDNAWGHHASCTCKIGVEADKGVLDSKFQVYGVTGLRVVDASIFPKIPGFFIVSSIYIAAEKAADVIHKDSVHGA